MFEHKRVKRPALECLEARWVPAAIRLVGGNLYISNPAGGTGLTVAATVTAGKFDITDNGNLVTVSGVSGLISITGTNKADQVSVALAGNTFAGRVLANLGHGGDTFGITGAGGTLGGGLTVLSGLGNDTVNVNANGAGALRIGGTVSVTDQAGGDKLTFGNGSGVTTVGGDLNVVGMNNVRIDQGSDDVVGGSVTVSLGTQAGPLLLQQGNLGGSEVLTVGKNFSINGGPLSDAVSLRGMNLGGNLTSNFGGGTNKLSVSSSAASVTSVNGALTYTGGARGDTADLRGGVVNGNVTLNLGEGNNVVQLAAFGAQTTTFGGNLTVNGGNGNNTITNNTAVIGGNVVYNLGNGNNNVSFDNGGSVGGLITYRSGNGNNGLTFAGSQTYQVNARFGSGDDTVTLNNLNAVLTGILDADGGSNTLTVTAGTLSPDLTLIGF